MFRRYLHYKEISYRENVDDLKFKKGDKLEVKIIEIKDEKIRFSKELWKRSLNCFENKESWRCDYHST